MKFDKVNQEVLKRLIKEKEVVWDKDDDWFYIIMEGNVGLWKVHRLDWYINLENDCGKNNIRRMEAKKLCANADGEYLKDTGAFVAHPTLPKTMLKVLENSAGEKIYVNEKLLANFENPQFRGTKPNGMIYVYEGYDLMGVVLPVKVNQ